MRWKADLRTAAKRGELRLSLFLLLALAGMVAAGCDRQPAVVDPSTTVLLTLPRGGPAESSRESALRRQLQIEPGKAEIAAELAQHYLRSARVTADARYLGYAERVLQPWRETTAPPAGVWLARATLDQAQHRFDAALTDLDNLLTHHPADHQARLTRAMVRIATGDFRAALVDCLQLAVHIDTAPAIACIASATLRLGGFAQSARLLASLADAMPDTRSEIRQWVFALEAEAAMALGNRAVAEQAFRRALNEPQPDMYTVRLYSDFLLAGGRYGQALAMSETAGGDDVVTLNAALAARQLDRRKEFERLRATLRARFRAAALHDDASHSFAQSLYALEFDRDVERALDLARRNWSNHKEPRDAALLARTAALTQDRQTLRDLARWLKVRGAVFPDAQAYIDQVLS